MATVKIVLRKKKNKDGTFPLALRITQNRRSTYIYLSEHIKASEWDADYHKVKTGHPNSKRLNNKLLKRLAETQRDILNLELRTDEPTLNQIKAELQKNKNRKTFFGQATLYFKNLEDSGKYNRVIAEKSAFTHFKEFLNNEDIAFPDITIGLLERYRSHLNKPKKDKNGEMKKVRGERTISNYLLFIRTIYRKAINDGVITESNYPFGRNKFHVKKPESLKIGLEKEEIEKLENIDLDSNLYIHHARNLWLISFYFAGMRVSDVLQLRWSDFSNNRLHYVMGKNQKPVSLKVPEKANAILKQYLPNKEKEDDLVFEDMKSIDFNDKIRVQRKIKYTIQKINSYLKKIAKEVGISKPLTMHIARHSFANLAGDKIPIQQLQKLYRHSSVITTIGYQKAFINKDADDALDSVLDF